MRSGGGFLTDLPIDERVIRYEFFNNHVSSARGNANLSNRKEDADVPDPCTCEGNSYLGVAHRGSLIAMHAGRKGPVCGEWERASAATSRWFRRTFEFGPA